MENPIIISNTTPLINFAEIGRMEVLEVIYGKLVIPPAVARELSAKSLRFPQPARVSSLPFVKTKARFWISDQLEARVLRDAGEG